MKIAKTAIIYPNVKLGKDCIVEDYCILGAPLADGSQPETVIGDQAHLRSFTVIYSGNSIGNQFKTGNKTNIREHNVIGNNVSIGTMSVIEHHVIIEDDVRIHTSAFIPEFSHLEKNSWVGPHVVFTNAKIPNTPTTKKELRGPRLKKGAVVGANSTLSAGIVVGENALIGSGTNLTKSVRDNSIAFGNPGSERSSRQELAEKSQK